MIRKTVFDRIGLLDEIYSPGGGEDIDFCAKAQDAGFKYAVVPNRDVKFTFTNSGYFPIYHKGEGTFTEKDIPEYSKVIIKKNDLPPISADDEGYNLRIRLVSQDRNRISFWTPLYTVNAPGVTEIPCIVEVVIS